MMEIPKKRYQSPALTVVEFKTEKGYAYSGGPGLRGTAQQFQMIIDENLIVTESTRADHTADGSFVGGYLSSGGSAFTDGDNWSTGGGDWF